MALGRTELIDLVQLAMKRVNVVPFEENKIAFGTNVAAVTLSTEKVMVCEAYINITKENRTVHLGFSATMQRAANSTFTIAVDGNDRPKEYKNTNATLNFTDIMFLGTGLHHIAVYAVAESTAAISPREAMLGVYL